MYSAVNTPRMKNVTIRLHLRTLAELEREAEENSVSRSEHIRTQLETRHQHDPVQDEYEAECERLRKENADLEARIDDLKGDLQHERARADELQSMLKVSNRRNDETTQELVRYVEGRRKSRLSRLKAWVFEK